MLMSVLLNDETLAIAVNAASHQPTQPSKVCTCTVGVCIAWESSPEERWPQAQMQPLGTLRDPDLYEPTFEQHHPDDTNYDSVDAPISALHFPYNRCDAFQCGSCERILLRYTEYGGYYVDHRVRWAQSSLLN
jgi:hypothetical protein